MTRHILLPGRPCTACQTEVFITIIPIRTLRHPCSNITLRRNIPQALNNPCFPAAFYTKNRKRRHERTQISQSAAVVHVCLPPGENPTGEYTTFRIALKRIKMRRNKNRLNKGVSECSRHAIWAYLWIFPCGLRALAHLLSAVV